MTAPHVIERLKKEKYWFIFGNNDHEIALIHNALFDIRNNCKWELNNLYLSPGTMKNGSTKATYKYCGIYYCDLEELFVGRFQNLTDWFFKEVNNY